MSIFGCLLTVWYGYSSFSPQCRWTEFHERNKCLGLAVFSCGGISASERDLDLQSSQNILQKILQTEKTQVVDGAEQSIDLAITHDSMYFLVIWFFIFKTDIGKKKKNLWLLYVSFLSPEMWIVHHCIFFKPEVEHYCYQTLYSGAS